jgi:outer membrane immunogenic protein
VKKILVVGVVASLAMGSAGAANLSVKAPLYKSPPVAVFSWTGCYVGGTLGAVGGDQYDLTMSGQFLAPVNIFSNPANNSQLAHSYRPNAFGVAAGAQLGCNYQVAPRFVIGIEGDFNGSALRERINSAYGPAGPFVGTGAVLASSHTEAVGKDLRWFSTVRGRAGFTADRLFFYGTAGLAIADYASSTNVTFGNDQFFLSEAVFQGSTSRTHAGWVAGLGAEWALSNNWSIKGEWLHLDVGNISYTDVCVNLAPGCGGPGPGPKGAWFTNVRLNEEIFRIGANYKFR